jgi:hypothetical protein
MALPITTDSTVRATREQVSAEVAGETVILGLANGIYFGLDAVGTRVWQLLREPRRVSDIRDTIVAEYDVDAKTCEADLVRLLADLASHKLIELNDSTAAA